VSVDRPMAEHGLLMSIPTLQGLLSDCPKRVAANIHDVCGSHIPQLPAIFQEKSGLTLSGEEPRRCPT
jgi:hypothetical protein